MSFAEMPYRPFLPANKSPLEIVWVDCRNSLENPNSTGKDRPAVLLDRHGTTWRTVCLTTSPGYQDGHARVELDDATLAGTTLRRPSYLWCDHITNIPTIDVHSHIGWANDALVETILGAIRLGTVQRIKLRRAVEDRRNFQDHR